jgi:hypothetical protein
MKDQTMLPMADGPPYGGRDMKYVNAWREFYRPLEEAFGAHVNGFDPAMDFQFPDGHYIHLTVEVVRRLRPYIVKALGEES